MRRFSILLGVLAVALTQRAWAQDGRPLRDHGLRWSIAGGLVARSTVNDVAAPPSDVGGTVGLAAEQAHGWGFGWGGAVGFTYFGGASSTPTGTPMMLASQPATQIAYGTLNLSWRPRIAVGSGLELLAGVGEYHRWERGSNAATDALGVSGGVEIPLAPRVSLDASVQKLLPRLGAVQWMFPVRLSVTL